VCLADHILLDLVRIFLTKSAILHLLIGELRPFTIRFIIECCLLISVILLSVPLVDFNTGYDFFLHYLSLVFAGLLS
jgi:hypothetical protein